MTTNLPKDTEKKKIDKKKFIELAEKVRKIFEEEARYAEKEEKKNGSNNSSRLNLIT
jgi:hypothetical protein